MTVEAKVEATTYSSFMVASIFVTNQLTQRKCINFNLMTFSIIFLFHSNSSVCMIFFWVYYTKLWNCFSCICSFTACVYVEMDVFNWEPNTKCSKKKSTTTRKLQHKIQYSIAYEYASDLLLHEIQLNTWSECIWITFFGLNQFQVEIFNFLHKRKEKEFEKDRRQ